MIFLAVNIIKQPNYSKTENEIKIQNQTKENVNNTIEEEQITQEENEIIQEETHKEWKIEIPSLSLIAEISEGTDKETLSKYVGHFEQTPKKEGNVCLAGHNRGYQVNYFGELKKLERGEEIIYTCEEFTKTYVVTKNIKISDEDWSNLENSNQNQITLITCIENEPQYRRCVQAIEKEEK